MDLTAKFIRALRISGSRAIARRYFVTNGFDGALALLGLLVGFRIGGEAAPGVELAAGFGTAVALGVSGLSSAYISESAERRREFARLRAAMVDDLAGSTHDDAARVAPLFVALVNGLSPFVIAQLTLVPLWLVAGGVALPLSPVDLGIAIALLLVFLLGVFLGRLAGTFWLWAGLRATLLAAVVVILILLFGR